MKPCPLSSALSALLPTAVITRRREQDWRSATFSGVRLVLELQVEASGAEQAQRFAAQIADQEFVLPGLLVADIVVTDQRIVPDGIAIMVEALLLEDEA